MPKVSVVVPIYNVEKYLARCVNSLINQTLKDIEIILVDDGSPDSCPAICDEFAAADERVKCIHTENRGLAKARVTGMKIATGEYIAFIDSDDWADINMYKTMYDVCIDSGADIVQCGYRKTSGESDNSYDDNTDYSYRVYDSREAIRQLYGVSDKADFNFLIWNKLYRAEIFNGLQLPVEIKVVEDAPFIPRLFSKSENIAVIDNIFINYFSRNDDNDKSIMDTLTENEEKLISSHIISFENISEFFYGIDNDLYMISLRHTLSWCLSAIKRRSIDREIRKKAARIIKKSAVLKNPYLPFKKKAVCLLIKIIPIL